MANPIGRVDRPMELPLSCALCLALGRSGRYDWVMFPTMQQRLILAGAVVVAGLVYLPVGHGAGASAGQAGCTIMFSHQPIMAGISLAGASFVAIVLGLVAGAAGHWLSGPFVVGSGMLFAAAQGGTIRYWLNHDVSTGAYLGLAVESLLWAIPGLLIIGLMRWARTPARGLLPKPMLSEPTQPPAPRPTKKIGGASWAPAAMLVIGPLALIVLLQPQLGQAMLICSAVAVGLQVALWFVVSRGGRVGAGKPGPSLEGMIIAPVLAIACCVLLLRSPEVGQIIGGLLIAFILASTVPAHLYPHTPTLALLLNPTIVAIAAYLTVAIGHLGQPPDALRGAAFAFIGLHTGAQTGWLLPLGLVLPVYYGSAGLAGSAMGIGWGWHLAHQTSAAQTQAAAADGAG